MLDGYQVFWGRKLAIHFVGMSECVSVHRVRAGACGGQKSVEDPCPGVAIGYEQPYESWEWNLDLRPEQSGSFLPYH